MGKALRNLVLLVVSVFLIASAAFAAGNGNGQGSQNTTTGVSADQIAQMVNALPYQSLSDQEIQDIEHMREEEKLARDVYTTLYNTWQMNIFNNIAKSEQTHMDMVKALIDKYQLPDPVEQTGDQIGVFSDDKLQSLYNQLVEEGQTSLVDALKVGATIEDLDIYDLQKAISDTDNEDVAYVFNNLMQGSRNHLRSFVSTLEKYNASYTPQYISQDEFDSIINSPMENNSVQPNPQVACKQSPFSDVPTDAWYCPYVAMLKNDNITQGYTDGTFRPEANITRAEVAKMIVLADNITVPSTCTQAPFNDVKVGDWYCRYVEALKDAGLVSGTGNGMFEPTRQITRAEVAKMVALMAGLTIEPCTTQPFSDVPTDAWYCQYVQALKADNLTTGYPDGTFRPDQPITRAEAAALIYRAMEYKRLHEQASQ